MSFACEHCITLLPPPHAFPCLLVVMLFQAIPQLEPRSAAPGGNPCKPALHMRSAFTQFYTRMLCNGSCDLNANHKCFSTARVNSMLTTRMFPNNECFLFSQCDQGAGRSRAKAPLTAGAHKIADTRAAS